MIINVPDHKELEEVSLRLLFKAWAQIASIIGEWDNFADQRTAHHFLTGFDDPEVRARTEDELKELEEDRKLYLKAAQNDLQSIYTLIQQSQEIGLKARICEISPYLLLKKKNAPSLDKGTSNFDFLDMPTHDAGELPDIHDTFCEKRLSNSFRETYDKIRKNRNKIYHLGIYKNEINPQLLIETIIDQYIELYTNRVWWKDRLQFATNRWSELQPHDEWNELSEIIHEISRLEKHLSDKQFNFLMAHEKSTERFICYDCVSSASLDHWDSHCSDFPSAYQVESKNVVRCVVCDETTEMTPETCIRPECRCGFKSAYPDAMDRCMKCGLRRDEAEEILNQNEHVKRRASERAINSLSTSPILDQEDF